MRPSAAFTLVELLAVLAIIGVLSGILLVVVGRAHAMADRASTTGSLRAIGMAINAYANDNRGTLPGPLYIGQPAAYSTKSTKYLGYFLWSYLGDTEPTTVARESSVIVNRAYLRLRTSTSTPVYTICKSLRLSGDTSNVLPFGDPNASDETSGRPIKLALLSRYELSKSWAMQDVDQLSPEVANYSSTAKSAYLPEPPLGDIRMTLYFDWHVAPVPVE
jgi:prepilin-type N-terminal cleavage/methylation domain-containing protein